ncbi:hypothetical protein [uncultured Maricaulis sp.]|uniref:hypothetical protein n=1 Tax=uncultured Maricaulis sp. TaxID=174710 RepID=UPI0030DA76DE|tara:strand:- start:77949 stop:78911 length:963 start_codon:yes stop_codon:yes gene_type:complete
MTERFRFFDALTYGIRTLFWRPVRALAFIAALSALYAAYYLWAQSAAGIGFFAGYMQSATQMAQGDFGSFGGYFAALMGVSMILSSVVIAGVHRVYIREAPAMRLPLQLGFDELRTLGVYILIVLIDTGIMLLSLIPVAFLLLLLRFIPGIGDFLGAAGDPNSPAAAVGIMMIIMIPLMFFYLYVIGRLSVGLALTIRDRKFRLGGWKASKGAGMQLFWAHLVLYLVLIGIVIVLSPNMMSVMTASMSGPEAMHDPAVMAAVANPYGALIWLAIPLQALMIFLVFGPSAAIANWDARKRAAAEAPAIGVAPGVGTGEVNA